MDSNINTQSPLGFIPQRPPFLFVDKVIDRDQARAVTTKYLSGEEDFFRGHFPGNPIMPGVLLLEAAFQTGGVLMGKLNDEEGLGVVTKIETVRFKNFVRPKDTIETTVELIDKIDNAYYMKGKILCNGKTVVSVKFTCAYLKEQ